VVLALFAHDDHVVLSINDIDGCWVGVDCFIDNVICIFVSRLQEVEGFGQ
jgi:hypothetical protein